MPDCVNHSQPAPKGCGAQGTRRVGPREVACDECAPKILAAKAFAKCECGSVAVTHVAGYGDVCGECAAELAELAAESGHAAHHVALNEAQGSESTSETADSTTGPSEAKAGGISLGTLPSLAEMEDDRRIGAALKRVLALVPDTAQGVLVCPYAAPVACVEHADGFRDFGDGATVAEALDALAERLEASK